MDEKLINELLECSVCLERFDQNCKVLPCQHTFCRRCLDEILATKQELRCPECRALVTHKIADLPTNILVVRILEGLKTKGHRPQGGISRHLGSVNLSSSPSKVAGTNPLHRHDPSSAHHFRQLQGTQPCARALFNYESSEKEDLPLKKGEVVLLRRQIDDNWYQGEAGGRLGFFPANFVQVLVPLPQIPQCKALYDFELKDENEKDCLKFKKDEVLTVIRRVDENWLEGRKGDKIGIFPITFVELNDAARSLINLKSNLTILPSSSSSSGQTTSAPHTTAGTTSVTNTNRNGNTSISNSTTVAGTVTTTTASVSSTSSPASTTLVEGMSTVAVSPSIQIPQSEAVVITTADSQVDSSSTETVTTNQASSSTATADGALSATVSSPPEVLPQNKRHSYTSSSLSPAPISAVVTTSPSQQRHSAEVALTSGGSLTIVNSDMTSVTASSLSSSSLPTSSASEETKLSTSASPKNTPSSPVTISEENPEASTSATNNSGSVQSGSLTIPLYIALYNYKPQKDDELELHKGDHYTVSEKCQDGWYKGACVRTGQAGVFPGNYVNMVRHSSAFKPVNPNVLNIRAKGPPVSVPAFPPHISSAAGDQRPPQVAAESSNQAPPLMPRVAKMSTSAQKPRSPCQLSGTPLRSLSSPGTSTISTSPKHTLISSSTVSSTSSTSPHISFHSGLSRPMIPAPPSHIASSSPHRSLWVPPNLAAMQQSMSASANITPPNVVMAPGLDSSSSALASSGKDKKEKKEKEKKGLVKLLAGKKKSKQAPPDPEPAPPLAVLCFDNVAHVRSGSYPANGTAGSSVGAGGDASVVSAHRKAASFDATTTPPVPAKPRPKLVLRERYCCIVPYPPQTEHELALELGDIIHVHRKREDGWYKGTQERTGKTGMFPASFVEKCD